MPKPLRSFDYTAMISPNRAVSSNTARLIILVQTAIFLLLWSTVSFPLLPKPGEILNALADLWQQEGLGQELLTSFYLNLEAIALSIIISLLLAYSAVIPIFRPLITVLSKLRFLSLAGLTFLFTLLTHGGHELKLSLLVFSVSVFFITGMADVIDQIPKEKYDLARTLRMGEWRVVWEVIILGRIDSAFDILRQNAAIGWLMLTTVEGLVRSGGGIGALLLNQNKHFRMEAVFAIQIVVFLTGLAQDYFIVLMKKTICPYSNLTLERK